MKLTLDLLTSDAIALRRFASEFGFQDLNLAASFALQQFLIAHGYIEPEHELDEDTETAGEA